MTRTIFITGASSGLGRATALFYARQGWYVIASARRVPEDDHELLGTTGVRFTPLDVADGGQIKRVAAESLAQGPIDLVFANAGYALGGPLEGMSDADLTDQIGTNLLGPIRTVQAFLPHFRERGAGGFLVTASPAGRAGMPMLSAYCASKFGLIGWAEAFAFELPSGVFIKIIVPGSMKTNFLNSARWARHPAYTSIEDQAARFYGSLSDGATDATPQDVARAVWDAASDTSSTLTYLVTQEARDTIAAREAAGEQGFRDALVSRLAAGG